MKSLTQIITSPSRIPGQLVELLPDKAYARVMYYRKTKKLLRLKNPRTYGEKIQWLKFNGGLEGYTTYVDKYDVRDYIEQKIGAQYLIPLIGKWDNFDDIPFEELPNQFVLKATHGSGYNFICRDKSKLDLVALKALTTKWKSENFFSVDREPQYKLCTPKLVVEQYLEDESGELRDYKITCFSGVPHIIFVIGNRTTSTTLDAYDSEWNKMPLAEDGYSNSPETLPKPEELAEMLRIANKLSEDFPFVRVDLYLVNGKVYFGELTFTPANGMVVWKPDHFNYSVGDLIDLSSFKQTIQAR